jgi:hypothetical protein
MQNSSFPNGAIRLMNLVSVIYGFVFRICFGFRISSFGLGRIALVPLLVAVVLGGCHNGQSPCEDIPPGAIPQPNGTYLCQWTHAQTACADRDRFVIYQYEWSADATKLTQNGQGHVTRIAQTLAQVSYPVVIEVSTDPHLDEMRRMTVLEALANCHAPIVPERVIIGRPDAEGLYGQEAAGVAARAIGNASGGQGAGVSGGATGGAIGGGLSGGASTGGGVGIY